MYDKIIPLIIITYIFLLYLFFYDIIKCNLYTYMMAIIRKYKSTLHLMKTVKSEVGTWGYLDLTIVKVVFSFACLDEVICVYYYS